MSNDSDALSGIAGQLRKLGELKEQLDSLDDRIREQLREVEAGLHALKLGVPISVPIGGELTEYGEYEQRLTFDKLDGQWRLYVTDAPIGADPEHYAVTRLAESSRDLRAVVLAKHVPALLAEAVSQMNDRVAARTKAVASGDKLLGALREAAK